MALTLLKARAAVMDVARQNSNELRLLFWETTAGCNLECVHCRRLEVSRQLMQNDLTTAECLQFVRALAGFARPILVLSGGEPLFRPDIFQIARCARQCGLPVALATNGTLINESVAREIVDSGIRRVAISVDGADEQTHDQFRRQPGSLAAALRGFRLLRALGMSMQINCTVTRHNLHQLEQLYALALDLGADALHLFMLVPVGCGVQIAESNMLPAEEYERVLHWIYDRSLERKIHLKATCAPHYFRVMKQRQTEARRGGSAPDPPATGTARAAGNVPHEAHSVGHPAAAGHHNMAALTKGCLAGSEICFVSHTGEVFPCGYLPLSAGNIKRQSLSQIWEQSPLFARLRDDAQLGGKCGLCEFKRICLGCRARAYYQAGDYMAEEPYCVYRPRRLSVGGKPATADGETVSNMDKVLECGPVAASVEN